jgi:hypothetical protein
MKLLVTYLTPPATWQDQVVDVSRPLSDHRDLDLLRRDLPGFVKGSTVIVNIVALPIGGAR